MEKGSNLDLGMKAYERTNKQKGMEEPIYDGLTNRQTRKIHK